MLAGLCRSLDFTNVNSFNEEVKFSSPSLYNLTPPPPPSSRPPPYEISTNFNSTATLNGGKTPSAPFENYYAATDIIKVSWFSLWKLYLPRGVFEMAQQSIYDGNIARFFIESSSFSSISFHNNKAVTKKGKKNKFTAPTIPVQNHALLPFHIALLLQEKIGNFLSYK